MLVQFGGLVLFGGLALIGLSVAPEIARYVLAAGWLGHGVWDLVHLRRDKVVSRSYAEWCGVLDVLIAAELLLGTRIEPDAPDTARTSAARPAGRPGRPADQRRLGRAAAAPTHPAADPAAAVLLGVLLALLVAAYVLLLRAAVTPWVPQRTRTGLLAALVAATLALAPVCSRWAEAGQEPWAWLVGFAIGTGPLVLRWRAAVVLGAGLTAAAVAARRARRPVGRPDSGDHPRASPPW